MKFILKIIKGGISARGTCLHKQESDLVRKKMDEKG
jgi:hypothetical protein